MTLEIQTHVPNRDLCGEGPLWDTATNTLVWVDIERGLGFTYDPASGDLSSKDYGVPLVFTMPTRSGNGVLVGKHHTIEHVDASGNVTVLATINDGNDDLRVQDAKCDKQGRLVFGSFSKTRKLNTGALYSLDPSGELTVLKPVLSLANGLDWSPNGEKFYHVDSDMQNIEVYDYDQSTGAISNGRVFCSIPLWEGLPDGMAVDTEGGVWVALFGGKAVRRYDENGKISEHLEMPTTNVTSCIFGGQDLQTMFVTSAALWLPEGVQEETAGALFECRPGATGTVTHPFGI